MKAKIILFFLAFATPSLANQIVHEVVRSSDLEAALGYQLTVLDKNDAWLADGLDRVFPINGAAREYIVRFRVPVTGRLKDIFGLMLKIDDEKGPLVVAPLAMTRSPLKDEIYIEIILEKAILAKSVLSIRCGNGAQETSYTIALQQYEPR